MINCEGGGWESLVLFIIQDVVDMMTLPRSCFKEGLVAPAVGCVISRQPPDAAPSGIAPTAESCLIQGHTLVVEGGGPHGITDQREGRKPQPFQTNNKHSKDHSSSTATQWSQMKLFSLHPC